MNKPFRVGKVRQLERAQSRIGETMEKGDKVWACEGSKHKFAVVEGVVYKDSDHWSHRYIELNSGFGQRFEYDQVFDNPESAYRNSERLALNIVNDLLARMEKMRIEVDGWSDVAAAHRVNATECQKRAIFDELGAK